MKGWQKVVRQVETKAKDKILNFQEKIIQVIKQDNFISISVVHNDNITVMIHFSKYITLKYFM